MRRALHVVNVDFLTRHGIFHLLAIPRVSISEVVHKFSDLYRLGRALEGQTNKYRYLLTKMALWVGRLVHHRAETSRNVRLDVPNHLQFLRLYSDGTIFFPRKRSYDKVLGPISCH